MSTLSLYILNGNHIRDREEITTYTAVATDKFYTYSKAYVGTSQTFSYSSATATFVTAAYSDDTYYRSVNTGTKFENDFYSERDITAVLKTSEITNNFSQKISSARVILKIGINKQLLAVTTKGATPTEVPTEFYTYEDGYLVSDHDSTPLTFYNYINDEDVNDVSGQIARVNGIRTHMVNPAQMPSDMASNVSFKVIMQNEGRIKDFLVITTMRSELST